ncbi:MAG: hypothetical protein HWD86_01005 [Kangiellaceae bacterium]|nr:hypothetical protein [Kangiellaceae bacterium]
MLEQILKYHQQLISQEFVDSLMNRIQKQYQQRHLILGVFITLGFIAGILGFIKLWPTNMLNYFDNLNHETMLVTSLCVVALTVFVTWLLNDEFERP